jgi:hypothetical protein
MNPAKPARAKRRQGKVDVIQRLNNSVRIRSYAATVKEVTTAEKEKNPKTNVETRKAWQAWCSTVDMCRHGIMYR